MREQRIPLGQRIPKGFFVAFSLECRETFEKFHFEERNPAPDVISKEHSD
jgi:hypothetical protein